jgi:uncharacterized protein (TIRG00374 family)
MRLDWRAALGFVFSALFLWLALRSVHLGDVGSVLRNANGPLFLLSAAVSTCIFPLRARRWRTILAPSAGELPFGPLWRATAIGMMINNVVPARAGEVGRAFALSREQPQVAFTTALASLAVDRIFDAIVLLALMFGAMLSPAFPVGATLAGMTITQFASIGITGVLVLLAICWLAVLLPERVIALVGAVARRVVPRFESRLVAVAQQGLGGLAVLRDGRRFLAVLWWALAHWLVHALALWIGFQAIGLAAPFSAALFLQGVLGFAVALPSSPGFVGVFELAAVRGLAVYAVPEASAFSWAIGYHVLSFIPITVIGLVYFLRLGLRLQDLQGASPQRPTPSAPPGSGATATESTPPSVASPPARDA